MPLGEYVGGGSHAPAVHPHSGYNSGGLMATATVTMSSVPKFPISATNPPAVTDSQDALMISGTSGSPTAAASNVDGLKTGSAVGGLLLLAGVALAVYFMVKR